jgi:hypothetical protein
MLRNLRPIALFFLFSSTVQIGSAAEADYFAARAPGSFTQHIEREIVFSFDAALGRQVQNTAEKILESRAQGQRALELAKLYGPDALFKDSDDSFFSRAVDSSEALNDLTNRMLDKAAANANIDQRISELEGQRCRPELMYRAITDVMNGNIVRSKIEVEADKIQNISKLQAVRQQTVYADFDESDGSIYRERKFQPCCSSIFKMGDHLVSGDKLDHFFEYGFFYNTISGTRDDLNMPSKYEWPVAELKDFTLGSVLPLVFKLQWYRSRTRGNLKDSLEFGLASEKGSYGLSTTGVLSYADLAANYQGLRFYREAVDGPNPYFKCERGEWSRTKRQFEWATYVDDSWDETVNCNSYSSPSAENKVNKKLTQLKVSNCPIDRKRCQSLGNKHGKLGDYILHPDCRSDSSSSSSESEETVK